VARTLWVGVEFSSDSPLVGVENNNNYEYNFNPNS
jgi:hypothetical protein